MNRRLIFAAARGTVVVLAAVAVVCVPTAKADSGGRKEQKSLRVFFIGNSLTDGIRLEKGFRSLAESRGHVFNGTMKRNEFSRLLAGAPLWWHWYEKGQNGEPYSTVYHPLLTKNRWDVLCLQPYTGPLYGMHYRRKPPREQGDVQMCSNFIDLAVKDGISPDLQVCIYSHWPHIDGYGKKDTTEQQRKEALARFDFSSAWDAPYTEGGPDAGEPTYRSTEQTGSRRTRTYFEQLADILNKKYEGVLNKPVLLIPVGDVMYELNKRLHANPQPGADGVVYSDIKQFYGDKTHLRPGVGRYLMAMTLYATLYKESPVGLPVVPYNDIKIYYGLFCPDFQMITPNVQRLIQQTVWDVVSSHPYAGVAQASDNNSRN